MKKWMTFFLCLLFSISTRAQWTHGAQNILFDVFDVQMTSSGTGYFTGVSGIFKTVNGGSTQSNISPSFFQGFYLAFSSPTTGVVSGGVTWPSFSAQIIYTNDGGTTWSTAYTSSAGIGQVILLNSTTGFACTSSGDFLRTNNGGQSWFVIAQNQKMAGIQFPSSASIGYGIHDSTIVMTTTGGTGWTSIYTDSNKSFYSVHFVNDTLGFAGYNGGIMRTSDAGGHWTEIRLPGRTTSRFSFVSVDTGFASDNDYTSILRTTNGGLSWERQYVGNGAGPMCVSFNSGHGVVAGLNGSVYYTNSVGGPGKPFAVSENKSIACDSVVQFKNYSWAGLQCSWYYDNQLISHSYDFSHPARMGYGSDSVKLVVSNGFYTDTNTYYIPQIQPPTLPSVAHMNITADTICIGTGYFCITADTSSFYNTYTMCINGVETWRFFGTSGMNGNNNAGHCIYQGQIGDSARVVFTISNRGSCTTASDSVIREVYAPIQPRVQVTLLDSLVCADSTVRVRVDNTSPWVYYFMPGDTQRGNGGSIYLHYTLHINIYDTVVTTYVAEQTYLRCTVYGRSDSTIKIHIRWPGVYFMPSDSMVHPGDTINLRNLSMADSYQWYFDSTASIHSDTSFNSSVVYSAPGDKWAMLIGNTAQHCPGDTLIKYMYVGLPMRHDTIGGMCMQAVIDTNPYPQGGITAFHVDDFGNSYVAGYEYCCFGGALYNTATGAYLRKTDKNGQLLWSIDVPFAIKNNPHYRGSYINAISTDRQGNVYIGGMFGTEDQFQLGGISINLNINGTYGSQIFAAKLDAGGSPLWYMYSGIQNNSYWETGITDIKYVDESNVFLSVLNTSGGWGGTILSTAGSFHLSMGSVSVVHLDASGHYVGQSSGYRFTSTPFTQGSILGVLSPGANIVAGRNGLLGPKLHIHPDCTLSLVGYFYDSITFGSNIGIHSYGNTLSMFAANMDMSGIWLSAHTLFGTTLEAPEWNTINANPPAYEGSNTDWLPRFDFDSRKNIYITSHTDSLFFGDTTSGRVGTHYYYNYGSHITIRPAINTLIAKFGPDGHKIWSTQNRNYTAYNHITGIKLSPDESEVILTGYYSKGLDLHSPHGAPTLLLNNGDREAFIAALDTGGNVKWADNTGLSGALNIIFSAKTNNGNIYAMGRDSLRTIEFKYNLHNNCQASDSSYRISSCFGLSIALSYGTMPDCSGDSLAFTAHPDINMPNLKCFWMINGVATGDSGRVFALRHPLSAQSISCGMILPNGDTTVSNPITLSVIFPSTPAISRNGNVLTSNSGPGFTWLLNNNVVSLGSFNYLNITQNGTYTVVVIDSQGCSATSLPFVVSGLPNNMVVVDDQNAIKIYPSPNDGRFIIESTYTKASDLILSDIFGKIVFRQRISSQVEQVDVSWLAKGVYTAGVLADGQYTFYKLLIK